MSGLAAGPQSWAEPPRLAARPWGTAQGNASVLWRRGVKWWHPSGQGFTPSGRQSEFYFSSPQKGGDPAVVASCPGRSGALQWAVRPVVTPAVSGAENGCWGWRAGDAALPWLNFGLLALSSFRKEAAVLLIRFRILLSRWVYARLPRPCGLYGAVSPWRYK